MSELTRARLESTGARTLATVLLEVVHHHPACHETIRRLLAERAGGSSPADRGDETGNAPYMVGSSTAMQTAFHAIRNYAPYRVPVLVTGESGTGKELAARALHERSPYADGPFVALNCAALPTELVSSELFGHEKGAFTGAVDRKIGYFERAHNGTLFLDEVGQLPPDVQSTLLRVLQEGAFRRVGGQDLIQVDTRIVAATNSDLETAVRDGRFRDDLFYRLNVLRVHLPPLRERRGDIRLMAHYFTRSLAEEMGIDQPTLTERALSALELHPWPGNVREFISTMRRAMVVAQGDTIDVDHLDLEEAPILCAQDARRQTDDAVAARDEPADIAEALAQCGGNKSEAARLLGISRVTLYRRLQKGEDGRRERSAHRRPDPPGSVGDEPEP